MSKNLLPLSGARVEGCHNICVSGHPLRIKAKDRLAPKQLENGHMMLVNRIASPRHQINSEEEVRETREYGLAVAAAAMRSKVLF